MNHRFLWGFPRALFLLPALLLCFSGAHLASAQEIKLGGRAYLDYYYILSSPDQQEEGMNGFTYRRLYLTTDFNLSSAFSGRARLEASESTAGSKGPVPFVKDLYLRWKSESGHRVTLGVAPTPVWQVSEGAWGFRSLEKTILDRAKVASSRDFGVQVDGPITGDGMLRYAVMFGNNEGVNPEDDKYKRVYAQLQGTPAEALVFSVGGDYAGYGDVRDNVYALNAFAAYRTAAFRIGAEGFWEHTAFTNDTDRNDSGVSVFAAARLAPRWEAVARVDQIMNDLEGADVAETFFLAGLAFSPHANVHFLPNLLLTKAEGADDAFVTGRVTLHMDF